MHYSWFSLILDFTWLETSYYCYYCISDKWLDLSSLDGSYLSLLSVSTKPIDLVGYVQWSRRLKDQAIVIHTIRHRVGSRTYKVMRGTIHLYQPVHWWCLMYMPITVHQWAVARLCMHKSFLISVPYVLETTFQ